MDNYTFDVKINDQIKTVIVLLRPGPEDDDPMRYDVFQANKLLGTIYPSINDDGTLKWYGENGIPPDLVAEIGRQIEAVELE